MSSSSAAATMMIRLHPVSGLGGNELLRMECTERPDLDLHYKPPIDSTSGAQKPTIISLGKNTFTMIADPTLPRNAVDVVVESIYDDLTDDNEDANGTGLRDTIRLLADSSTFSFEDLPLDELHSLGDHRPKLQLRIQRYIEGFVSINNETVKTTNTIVKEGDILSLQSMSYSYDYVVMVQPISDATTSGTNSSAKHQHVPLSLAPSESDIVAVPPPTNAVADARYIELVDQQQKLMQQMVSDEFSCAICLDYQVRSTALVPCGHSFCSSCILEPTTKKVKHKVCSVCNTKITSHIPNRTIDSCFHLIVQFQSEQQQKRPPESDDEVSSSLVAILPQDDLENYKERSDEQTNIRLKKETSRRSKRSRTTTNNTTVRPPPIVPLPIHARNVPLFGLDHQLEMLETLLGRPRFDGMDSDDDDPMLQPLHRLFQGTPTTASNNILGVAPTIAARMHGATPTDAIEID